jgi:hypothetical protein
LDYTHRFSIQGQLLLIVEAQGGFVDSHRRRNNVTTSVEIEGCGHKPENASNHQKPGKSKNGFFLISPP